MNEELTTRDGVRNYMAAADSVSDWDRRTKDVKSANGGDYPGFWFSEIVMSGIADQTAAKWGGSAKVQVVAL